MHRHHRARRLGSLLALLGLLLTLGVPPAASAADPTVTLDLKASGLEPLTQVTSARDGSGRLFLVERRGTIRVFKDGALQPGFFLDMTSRVESSSGERGLLGLAFHPKFATNGLLYVFYTRPGGDVVIARWRANADRTLVMPSSFSPLLVVEHSSSANHNGGGLAFSRSGLLFASFGDGGGAGDPENDALNKTRNLLGKVIRINVNGTGAGRYGNYSIPKSNPFVGRSGIDEIWAYGLRNPWRISVDRSSGTFYVADVGQGKWEEVNKESATSAGGRNYGWHVMEGRHCYKASSCSLAGDTLPVAEYSHASGRCSITGGFVYRGPTQPALAAKYVFADFCGGQIYALPLGVTNAKPVLAADTDELITSFGESDEGELYAVTIDGKLFQVLAS